MIVMSPGSLLTLSLWLLPFCPGAESSWPHGCGRRPVSEPSFASTHALPASASSNSLAWASDCTVAAILRTRTAQGLRSSMTPSMLSSIGSSTSLQSRSQTQVPGHMSAVPVSWQVRLALHPLDDALHNLPSHTISAGLWPALQQARHSRLS